MRRVGWLVTLLVAPAAFAAPRALTLAYTGDNAAEVNRCGCRTNPSGGLARRKSVLAAERARGPLVVVDSGNALFRAPGAVDDAARQRAKFIATAMSELGTQAMAAGVRDLAAGVSFLQALAREAHLDVLSANLVDAKGKPVFAPSKVVVQDGIRVGLVGASPVGPVPGADGHQGTALEGAVLEAAAALRAKADVVVVLAAVPYADALQLATQAQGKVDFILQSHDARGTLPAQRHGDTWVLASGDRGRQVGLLRLDLRGKGGWVDLEEQARERRLLDLQAQNLATLRARLKATRDVAAKRELARTLGEMEASQKDRQRRLQPPGRGARTLQLEWKHLTEDVPVDPDLQARVARIEAPPAVPAP